MSQPVPVGDGSTSPSVHTVPTRTRTGVPNIAKQLQASAEFIIEGILGQVLIAFGGVSIFGVKPFAALAVLGKSIVDNANAAYANSLTAKTTADAANTKSDDIIAALVSNATGTVATVGTDASALALALLNEGLALPTQLFDQFAGLLAALTGQVTAIQNNPGGASQSDDFAAVALTAYTSILNTLTLVGGIIRTSVIAAGYVGTTGTPRKPLTDRHGIQILLDGKQRGVTRAWICGDATMSNYAAVEIYSGFDGDAARIVTGAGPSLVATQQQVDFLDTPQPAPGAPTTTAPARVQAMTAFDIRYDDRTNTFIVWRNGVPALSWPDSTNIVSHGSGKRFVGVVSNGSNDASAPGFGIKKVTFYDW